jgi:hypothetical protein
VNPWLLAAVAGAAIVLFLGLRQPAQPAGAGANGGTAPGTPQGGTTATALPPGTLPSSAATGQTASAPASTLDQTVSGLVSTAMPGQDAIVTALSAEPVGAGSTGVDTSAGQAAIDYQASESAISQLVNQVQAGQVPASALAGIPSNTQAGAFAASVAAQQAAIAAQPVIPSTPFQPGLARHILA